MNNERILVSRNKREGEYYGKVHFSRATGAATPARRARVGHTIGILSLKRRSIVWGDW